MGSESIMAFVRSIERPEQVRYSGEFDRIAADLS